MRSRRLIWLLFSLLCLAGAFLLWRWGDERAAGRIAAHATPSGAQAANPPLRAAYSPHPPVIAAPQLKPPGMTNMTPVEVAAATRAKRLSHRLSNTTKSLKELSHDDKAVLLENALVDTAQSVHLPIPDSLRAHGDPGSYIVQANGPIDNAFRALLSNAGANVISYIPNNAYLVRANASVADQLAADPQTQSVLPYEPYYKLKSDLLTSVVEQQPLPGGSALNVLLFADNSASTMSQLQNLGAQIVGQDTSPFGPVVKVLPAAGSVAAIAGLPGVEEVELLHRRAPANDLTRVIMGISPNGTGGATNNYLGLTGAGVTVNLNDTGVDQKHPDFDLGGAGPMRVFGPPGDLNALMDTDGHGTHVAGIIAGDGTASQAPYVPPILFASGSSTNPPADFRGKAPGALIYIQDLDFNEPFIPDSALQQGAATNGAYISNNSWGTPEDNTYSIESASYDAAVRDALPNVTGMQPLVYVFAVGNNGDGNTDGEGGAPDSVISPGTAKNVITVGATELPRFITNQFEVAGITNAYFYPQTDSSNQVAYFSSCGNVGVDIEGEFGRFKPDVVAPGAFVVSTCSELWNQAAYYDPTNIFPVPFFGITLAPGARFDDVEFIPANATSFTVTIEPNAASPSPFPSLPIYAEENRLPNFNTDTPLGNNTITVNFPPNQDNVFWDYSIHNDTSQTVSFDVLFNLMTTNNDDSLKALQMLNTNLAPWYRYESGTSMATPAVSGMLALMQQFFEQRVPGFYRPSPAMLKALVINGARTLSDQYDFDVQTTVNEQGWGMANLSNSIPAALANYLSYTNTSAPGPIQLFDQSMTNTSGNALYTGQSCTRFISLNNQARNQPLRLTLAWTDPPGNPAAAMKLVNNLDLVVTDLVSGEVFYGNDISQGSIYNNAHTTNDLPVYDTINNVQNIYLPSPPALDTAYSVTVLAQAVNVNAVTANSNNVAQDYALVVSSGNGYTNCLITVSNNSLIVSAETPDITEVTNGIPLLNQEVGANSPLFGTNTIGAPNGGQITIGATNQWHFYIFTNNVPIIGGTNIATNVAFATFAPPELAVPREGVFQTGVPPDNATRPEADIDLFVSTDPGLLNLDTNVLEAAVQAGWVSVGQGGTESVVLQTNDGPGTVFYVGVQSEDRQAAQYGFVGIATAQPFSTEGANGSTLYGIPVPTTIPVGTARTPGAALIFAFAPESYLVQRVVVTNTITHQLLGDLLGNLSHNGQFDVLNNHTPGTGLPTLTNQTLVYDDNEDGAVPGSTNSDGPGTLRNFIGTQSVGMWMLTMVDNSPTETGQVSSVEIGLTRESGADLGSVLPGEFYIASYTTPLDATNLTIGLTFGSGGPLQMLVGNGYIPTLTNYDETTTISAPGWPLVIGPNDIPPFSPGTYYVVLYNPTAATVNFALQFTPGINVNGAATQNYSTSGSVNLLDDQVNTNSITIANNGQIVSVNVGVRINHPRISDLALTLVSPDGTRVLLMENRGNGTTNGAGSSITATNVFPLTTNGNFNVSSNTIETGQTSGTLILDYNMFIIPDDLKVYYGGNVIYDTGLISGTNEVSVPYGPGASTEITIVMNQGNNSNTNTEWEYTASVVSSSYSYLTFTDDTNLASIPIKFAVPPFVSSASTKVVYSNGFEGSVIGDYTNSQTFETFTVQSNVVSAVSDPYVAQGGNKYVALGDGSFTGLVPTTAGKKYEMNIAYRGPGIVSWWRGESNALDSIGTNNGVLVGATFTNAVVGKGFQFNGTNYVYVPYSPSLDFTNEFSLETWFRNDLGTGYAYGLISRRNCCASPPCNYAINIGASGVGIYYDDVTISGVGDDGPASQYEVSRYPVDPPANVFHHLVGTFQQYDSDHVQLTTFLDGQQVRQKLIQGNFTNAVSAQPLTIGTTSVPPSGEFLDGVMDEVSIYNRPLSLAEVSAIYDDGTNGLGKFDPTVIGAQSLAKAQFSAGNGAPETFYGQNTNWQVGSVFFTATGTSTPFYATGLEPGMLVDSLALTRLPSDLYYFPEEPLDVLKGQSANGVWTLELWDNRVGAPAPAGALVSWDLSFVFANQAADVTNVVAPGAVDVLTIQMPCNATFATNQLVSATGPVNVYFNPTTPPTGSGAGDIDELPNVTSGTFPLSPPTVTPCTTYYLGIQNSTTTNITFNFQVTFDYATANDAAATPVAPKVGGVSVSSAGVLLKWNGPTNQQYQVQWAGSLARMTNWSTFSNVVSSGSGRFSFMDNGSQTGGFGPVRFYRLKMYP